MTILGTPSDAIASALFGHTRRRVLALFFGRPGESFHVREILRLTRSGSGAVQRELKRLSNAGLIRRQSDGAQVRYAANPDSPVHGELTALMAKTAGIADVVRAALQRVPRPGKIQVAFIYGSIASGAQKSGSDVDLMVIGDVRLTELIPALSPAQEELAREVNPTVYSARDFRDSVSKRRHFVKSVLEGPKLYLIGSHNDVEELAGQPVADTTKVQYSRDY